MEWGFFCNFAVETLKYEVMIFAPIPGWLILLAALAVMLIILGGIGVAIASYVWACLSYVWDFLKYVDRKLGEMI